MSKVNLEHVMAEARKLNLHIEQFVSMTDKLERLEFRVRRNLEHARERLQEANFWMKRALHYQRGPKPVPPDEPTS